MAHVANLTIDNTKVSASLTDFPVYVNLADMNAEFWSTVANGGGDIRVFKSDGTTELAREVVSCDTSTETGELHFKYTGTLSSTVDTEVQIHADGTSADYATTATYGAENVWTGTTYVSHLQANSNNSSSTSITNTDTAITYATGKLLNGASMNGSSSLINLGSTINLNATNFSVAMWFYADVTGNKILWASGADPAGANWQAYARYGESSGKIRFGIYTSPSVTNNVSTNTYANGAWHRAVFTSDGTNSRIYVNGTLDATLSSGNPTINPGSRDFRIGDFRNWIPSGERYFDGTMDEVRVYQGTVLSADWITTEYNNQNSPSTFYTVTNATESIDLGLGEFTLTGYDITTALKVGTLELGLGEFVLTGYDPDFNFTGWTNLTKNASTWTNVDKVDSDWTNTDKVSSS